MKHLEFRWPCDGNTRLKRSQDVFRALLVNISRTGVRFSAISRVSSGEEIVISVLNQNFPATVIWAQGNLVGAQFASPLSGAEFAIFSKSSTRKGTGMRPAVVQRGGHGFQEFR